MATALLALASTVAASAASAGDLDRVVAFDINAKTLDKALLQFGAQADVRISFACNLSKTMFRTHEIDGKYTAREALVKLLEGTRLRYVAKERTIEIVTRSQPYPPPAARARKSVDPGHHADSASSRFPGRQPVDPPLPQMQQNEKGGQGLGEIIVTAQKYRQRAFDVPISLSVVTSRELQNLRIRSLEDLQYDVPGLYMQQTGGLNRITLQGVGNGIGNGALVGEYIDEADITGEGDTGANGAATGDVQLNDVSRVEVLRGPQGTLYGDGSMGGVIRVITNKPVLDRFQMGADVAELFTEHGAPSQHTQAMLNVPLITDKLGLRFAGDFAHDGGWIDEPQANLKNINGRNLTDVRLEALWRPMSQLNINAMQIIRRDAYGLGFGEDAQGNVAAPVVFGLTTEPNATQAFNLSNITVNYDGDQVRVVSSSTYFTHAIYLHNAFFQEQNGYGVVTTYALDHYQSYSDQDYSEELRISNAGEGPWHWMIGAFKKRYFDYDEQDAVITYPIPMAPVIEISSVGTRTLSNSSSGFANMSYSLSGRLTIGAGVRYFRDHETFNVATTDYHGFAGLGIIPGKLEEHDFTSTDPRYFARYRASDHLMLYMSAAKGFRQGGFNGPGFPPYTSESLWSYDLGTKMRLFGNRLQSNDDVFYSDYSNYVVDGLIPGLAQPYETNAGTAHIKGINVDVRWLLLRGWRIGLSAEYVDSKFASIAAMNTGYAVGDQVPFVTRYSFDLSAEREFRWDDKPGYATIHFSEMSPVEMRLVGYPVTRSDVSRFLSFGSGLDWNDHLRFGLFGRNLLNDRGNLDPFWVQGEGSRPQPRTFGVDFTVTFGAA